MSPVALAVFVAFGLFLLHMQGGRMQAYQRRCMRCNARRGFMGDRHAGDCPNRDRWGA